MKPETKPETRTSTLIASLEETVRLLRAHPELYDDAGLSQIAAGAGLALHLARKVARRADADGVKRPRAKLSALIRDIAPQLFATVAKGMRDEERDRDAVELLANLRRAWFHIVEAQDLRAVQQQLIAEARAMRADLEAMGAELPPVEPPVRGYVIAREEYLSHIVYAFIASPADSIEEAVSKALLVAACARLGEEPQHVVNAVTSMLPGGRVLAPWEVGNGG